MKSRSQVLGRGHLREHIQPGGFPGGSGVKHLPANAGATGDMGLTPTPVILAWEVPRWATVHGVKRAGHDWVSTHTQPSTMFMSPTLFSLLWTKTTKDCFSHLFQLSNFVLWKFSDFHGVGRILLWTTIDSKIAPCPFYFNWRISTLQYCNGFCHASTWISPGYTCVPAVLTSPPTSLLTPWPFQLLQLNFKILFRSTQPFDSFISM